MQPNESLYDQKPEEPAPAVTSTASVTTTSSSSYPSRFEYVENARSAETNVGSVQAIGHVLPPKSSSFFSEFGMDSGFRKKISSSSSNTQVIAKAYALVLGFFL